MMNELAVRKSEVIVPGRPASRQCGLPNLTRFLEVDRVARETAAAIAQTRFPNMRAEDEREPREWRLILLEGNRDQTAEALQRGASFDLIEAVIRTLSAALAAPPDRRVTLASVGLLLDSRSRQPANPTVYLEALAFDLVDEGFPPCVVVAACQRVRREQTFLPEIAEVVAACRMERDRLRNYLGQAERAFRDRRVAEGYLAHLAGRLEEVRALPEADPTWSKR